MLSLAAQKKSSSGLQGVCKGHTPVTGLGGGGEAVFCGSVDDW